MSTHNIRTIKASRLLVGGAIIAIAAGATAYTGVTSRAQSEDELTHWVADQAVPTVSVVSPKHGKSEEDIALPGTIQAFTTAPIFPRATGYVTSWSVDIGAKVKAGQVLATIDSPDLDQQLQQARADLVSAEANATLAAATAKRWAELVKTQIVSQQAEDEKSADAAAKAAAVQASKANVGRLEALTAFKNLTAPFDGIVTARSVDIGDLVGSGGTTGKPLFQIADIHKVRIYVRVPQAFLGILKPGLTASLALPQYPDQSFTATLVSTSNSVSEDTRTALVQLQADNANDKLWPGSFTEVHLHVPSDPNVLRVPATALVFGRQGMQVAIVDGDQKVALKTVQLGRNLGSDVEITAGLTLDDRLVDNPSEALENGDQVHVATTGAPANGGVAAAPGDEPKSARAQQAADRHG